MKSIRNIDTKRIEAAIADFEKEVDFELVPVIAQSSSYTEHIGWMISLILILLCLALIDLSFSNSWASKNWYYIATPFVSVILGHLLDKSDLVDRFFISNKARARQVFQRAQRIFYLKNLNELKRQNSLVLFISVMERKIVILPDPRIKFAGLNELQGKLLNLIQVEFKKGEFEQGFLKAIAFLQKELKVHFPKGLSATTNEFPNKLIWLEGSSD